MTLIELKIEEANQAAAAAKAIKEWLKTGLQKKGKLEEYKAALQALSEPIRATAAYQKQLEDGGKRDAEIENQLSMAWLQVANRFYELGEQNLSHLCMVKGWGWADRRVWDAPENQGLPIRLDQVIGTQIKELQNIHTYQEAIDAIKEAGYVETEPTVRQEPNNSTPTPLEVLNLARKAVPAVNYALGVAGIAAAGALIVLFLGWTKASIVLIGLIFVGMILLFLFSQLVAAKSKSIKVAGAVLLWAVLMFFVTFLGFTVTAFAAGLPEPWAVFLGIKPAASIAASTNAEERQRVQAETEKTKKIDVCVVVKVQVYETPFSESIKDSVEAEAPGFSGTGRTERKRMCYKAGISQEIIDAKTPHPTSCKGDRCSASPPEYSDQNRTVCSTISAWNDGQRGGGGGGANYIMPVVVRNVANDETKKQFRAQCEAVSP